MRRAALLALLLAAALAAPAPAAPSLGVNVANIPGDADIDQIAALGARDARMFLLWPDVEPTRGALDPRTLAVFRRAVTALAARGIRPIFVVTQSPAWASGSDNRNHPPRSAADYASFLGRFAATQGIAGHGVAYEVWNEPDDRAWWAPAPDAGAYASLFKAAAAAIHRADSTAKAILGPTTGNNYVWLGRLYGHGIRGTFDAAAVHTDTACLVPGPSSYYRTDGRIGQFSFLGYREVRATMLAHGDDKPIWMTELGWSSTQTAAGGPLCARGASTGKKPSGVTEEAQAAYLREAYHCLAEDDYVERAVWFTLRDDPGQRVDELRHYGLLRAGAAHKPAWDVFASLTARGDQLSGPCGDFAGPAITIHAPAEGQAYAGTLTIRASAEDPSGLSRFQLQADGRVIRNFGVDLANGRPVEIDWLRAENLRVGRHTIKVIARDKLGNESAQTVAVRRVTPREFLALGTPTVTIGGVRCARRICRLSGRVESPAGAPAPGLAQARWQWRRTRGRLRGRFVTMHKTLKTAGKPFTFRQRLSRGGRWRVTVRYVPPGSLRGRSSPFAYFRVP